VSRPVVWGALPGGSGESHTRERLIKAGGRGASLAESTDIDRTAHEHWSGWHACRDALGALGAA
jgi:hypothetical protein